MSVSETPARLAVHTVEDLVGLVPYLIGFHPRDSLVAVVLRDGRVEVTARVNLAEVAGTDGQAYLIGRLLDRFPSAELWFLAFTEDEELAWAVLAGCAALCGVMRLGRVVHVNSTHWRVDTPAGDGGPVGVSAAAAEAAVLGLPARPSRSDLEEFVAGPPDAEVGELFELFERVSAEVSELTSKARRRMLQRLVRSGGERVQADWVRLAVLAADPETTIGLLDGLRQESAEEQVALWTQVVRHCLVPYLPAPLGLLGVAAWLTGDGAMATVCLERIDRVDLSSPLAALLDLIITGVLPPDAWADCRPGFVGAVREWFEAAAEG